MTFCYHTGVRKQRRVIIMEVKHIFKKPNMEVANEDVLQFKTDNLSYCYTLFMAATKIDENNMIEVDRDSVLYFKVAPFIKREGVFSERPDALNLMNLSRTLMRESQALGYEDLLMGFYDHKKDTMNYEAFLKDYSKLEDSKIIDCYFTLKLKNMEFDKYIFEKEYEEIVEHISKNQHLPVTVDQFMLFKKKLETFIRSGMASPEIGRDKISDGLIKIMQSTFSNVETAHEQLIVSKFLDQLGCLDCRITTDRKNFKPLKDIMPIYPCEIVFVPNTRFLKIYSN